MKKLLSSLVFIAVITCLSSTVYASTIDSLIVPYPASCDINDIISERTDIDNMGNPIIVRVFKISEDEIASTINFKAAKDLYNAHTWLSTGGDSVL